MAQPHRALGSRKGGALVTTHRRRPHDPEAALLQMIDAAWPANAAALGDLQALSIGNPDLAAGFRTALARAAAQQDVGLRLNRLARARPAKVPLARGILTFLPKGHRR